MVGGGTVLPVLLSLQASLVQPLQDVLQVWGGSGGGLGGISVHWGGWVKARGRGHGAVPTGWELGVSVPGALCLRGCVRGPIRQDPAGAQAGRVRQDHPPPPGDLPRAGRHHLR